MERLLYLFPPHWMLTILGLSLIIRGITYLEDAIQFTADDFDFEIDLK